MNNEIINSIEKLKNHTDSLLIEMQKSCVPSLYDLKTEVRYSYNDHGFYHSIYSDAVTLLLCENIPFKQNQKDHVYNAKLKDLVEQNQVNPFLLFLDGKFIKWDDIVIIKDCKYSYIMVLNCHVRNPRVDCIMMPLNMRYECYLPIVDKKAAFIFNKFGQLIDKPGKNDFPYETIYIDNKDILKSGDTFEAQRQDIKDIDVNIKVSEKSLFVFKDGYLYDRPIKMQGLNVFSLPCEDYPYNKSMQYRAFYHLRGNSSKDNIYAIQNKEALKKEIKNGSSAEYIDKLNTPFDFSYDRHKRYDQNVSNALDYIMRYNSGLMNDVYKNKSNIDSRVYTGKQLKQKLDAKGFMHLSRMYKGSLCNDVMIFKNGLLFDKYNEIKYINKDILIPIGIPDDNDIYEFLTFKNIDNRIIDISFPSAGDDIYYLDPTVDLDNSKLFCKSAPDRDYVLAEVESAQFEVGFKWKRIDINRVKIIPNDSYFYDKLIRIASKNQFRYAFKLVKDDEEDFEIQLPPAFNFCNEKENFLVFSNGRRVNNKDFQVTTIKPTRPFDDVSVYITIPAKKGEKIEVFYLPTKLTDVKTFDNLELSGDICINRKLIKYNLSKDLYFIFVNGRKISINQLYDINQDTVRIITNTASTKNVTIVKHIDDDKILSDLFFDHEDLLTETIKSIPGDVLDKLYDRAVHNNIEPDMKEDQIPMKDIMICIIKDYWMRPYINNGEEMLFDFDSSMFDENDRDSDGNIVANPYRE